MCGSMADIQSATAEIRRGKKKEDRNKKREGKNIMSASATQGGHNNRRFALRAMLPVKKDKNSSGDEIGNVNFYAVRPEATRIR